MVTGPDGGREICVQGGWHHLDRLDGCATSLIAREGEGGGSLL